MYQEGSDWFIGLFNEFYMAGAFTHFIIQKSKKGELNEESRGSDLIIDFPNGIQGWCQQSQL